MFRCYVACDTKEKSVFTCVVYTLNSLASSTIYDAVVQTAYFIMNPARVLILTNSLSSKGGVAVVMAASS
jgi:hypothetical protein